MSRLFLLIALILASLPLQAQDYLEAFKDKGNGSFGYKDINGKVVIRPQFQDACDFKDDLAIVKLNNKKGYIDKTGKFVIQPQFEYATYFYEDLAGVKQGGKWGYIDKTGHFVVQPQFEDAYPFCEDLAIVKQGGKYGFIDKTGKFVIKPRFENAGEFKEGLAAVMQDGKWGYIDKTGKFYNSYKEANLPRQVESEWWVFLSYHLGSKDDFLKERGVAAPSEEEIRADVERELKAWAVKGEFESTAKWQERVNDTTSRAKAQELAKQCVEKYNSAIAAASAEYDDERAALAKKYEEILAARFVKALELKPYDADNETFLISAGEFGDIALPVPVSDAPAFKSNWQREKEAAKPEFAIVGDNVGCNPSNDMVLKSVTFGRYTYDSNIKTNYTQADADYILQSIDILTLSLGAPTPASTEFKVKDFEMEVKDLTARMGSTARVDNNGTKCAVLKVYVPDQIAAVHGNVVGDITIRGMEKWIYLTNGTKEIELVFDNHLPLHLKFADLDYPSLTSEFVYKLYLTERR